MSSEFYYEDLEALLTPEQLSQLKEKLKEQGKVLVRGVPVVPEVSEARTQSDWSCRKMAAKKYGRRYTKKRRPR